MTLLIAVNIESENLTFLPLLPNWYCILIFTENSQNQPFILYNNTTIWYYTIHNLTLLNECWWKQEIMNKCVPDEATLIKVSTNLSHEN
jgi:hypothetical protein